MDFKQINQDIPLFNELIQTFQVLYPNNPCLVAGGAVRDILLGRKPKDIDMYFLGLNWQVEDRKEFANKMSLSGIYHKIATNNLPWHKYERYLLLSIIYQVEKELQETFTEVQFMGFPANDMESLLKTFDWEICLFGYKNGVITTIESAMKLIETIKTYNPDDKDYKPPKMKLCNVQFPVSNLRRGFKFEQRYPLKLDYQSILKLCSEVLAEDKKGVPHNV